MFEKFKRKEETVLDRLEGDKKFYVKRIGEIFGIYKPENLGWDKSEDLLYDLVTLYGENEMIKHLDKLELQVEGLEPKAKKEALSRWLGVIAEELDTEE